MEWKAIPFPRESLNPGIKSRSPAMQANSLLSEPPGIIPETLPQYLSFNVNASPWGPQVLAGECFSLQAYMNNFKFWSIKTNILTLSWNHIFLLGLCSTFLLKWVLRGPIFMWGSQYKFVPNLVWTQHQFLMLIQQHISYSLIFRTLYSSRWRIKPQYNFHLQFPFFCYFLEVPSIDFKRMFIVVHLSFYVLLCEDFLINWCFIQII